MKTWILILFSWLCIAQGYSQTPNSYKVKAGDDPTKVIPINGRYRYPEFRDGYLYYVTDKLSTIRKLNYNIMVSEVRYIDDKGDTLTIMDDQAVIYVQIGRDFYYHDLLYGYFEILSNDEHVKLVSQQELRMLRREMVENNGYMETTSIANNYTSTKYSVRSPTRNIQNEDVVYHMVTTYYLVGRDRTMVRASRLGFLKMFGNQRDEILAYLKQNDVNFRREDDLTRLLHYCCDLAF
jgi:hypothetical protein